MASIVSTAPTASSASPEQVGGVEKVSRRRLKAIFSGLVGNLVEWYDWYVFSAFSLYFSASFFPSDDTTAQLLQTAGIFALGFLMRPIGGWMFGRIADKVGRKQSMTLSVLLMSLGSLLIALTPTYQTVGIVAPVMLLTARLLQGLSVGGEYGVSTTYLSEMATTGRRGFYSSLMYLTLIGGQLLALGILLALQHLLTAAELLEWGWRLPFVIGAALSVVALLLRANLTETDAFDAQRDNEEGRGSLRLLLQHPQAVAIVVGLTMGGTLAFYTFTTYMLKFLVNTAHLPREQATLASFASLVAFAVMQPVFGSLADRFGRRPMLLAFGVLGTLGTVPLLLALSHARSVGSSILLLLPALAIVSCYSGINAVVKAGLFPTQIRALGIGLPHALTVAVFGGTAEYIALWCKDIGHESYFYWYVAGCIFVSLLVVMRLFHVRQHSYL
ncbi:MFS transporter [Hymenobacter sp. BT186]|uniref:MFS transporter n=1 Tax=Hymenobacter telluris TaxID=2816474 RepID=A0A939F0M8_9BACT|nr:MFS transporter [Hymenobacter telluris]MBO0360993.1 MFS transporter [Hymenobacter telluris]MBW3377021.1 MFS transporter [Hymenobacter norwichensis]